MKITFQPFARSAIFRHCCNPLIVPTMVLVRVAFFSGSFGFDLIRVTLSVANVI